MTCENCVPWCSFNFFTRKAEGLDASISEPQRSDGGGNPESWTDKRRILRKKRNVMLSVVFTHTRKLQNKNTGKHWRSSKTTFALWKNRSVLVFNAQRQECFVSSENCSGSLSAVLGFWRTDCDQRSTLKDIFYVAGQSLGCSHDCNQGLSLNVRK